MNHPLFFMTSISAKVALLGAMVWIQLYLLRRAPASARNRLCAASFVAVLLLAAGEVLAPGWLLKGPAILYTMRTAAGPAAPSVAPNLTFSWLTLAWITGFAFMLVRAIAGRSALARLRRRSTLLQQASGIDVRTADVQTPLLCGVLRPAILLPDAASQWTEEQRRMVLTHELAHFRQRDHWTNLLAQLVRAALWFHPVVWWLASRLSREQELACDEAVVSTGVSPHDYAAFLLEIARSLSSRDMFCCAMAGSGARSLKQRFANLLDTRPRPALSRRLAASLALFAAVATMLAVVRPVWSQSAEKKGGAYRVGNGVTPPKVLHKVEPKYNQEDKDAKIQGPVLLQLIVTEEGNADNIKVVRSLSPGLDQKAIEALSQWTFQPGTKDGKAVPVWATVEINFRLL